MSTVGRVDSSGPLLQGKTSGGPGMGTEPARGNEPAPPGSDRPHKEHSGQKEADVPMLVKKVVGHWPVYMKHEVDPASGRTQVILIDPQTGEVIRKIPPDAEMHLAAALHNMAGTLLNRHI